MFSLLKSVSSMMGVRPPCCITLIKLNMSEIKACLQKLRDGVELRWEKQTVVLKVEDGRLMFVKTNPSFERTAGGGKLLQSPTHNSHLARWGSGIFLEGCHNWTPKMRFFFSQLQCSAPVSSSCKEVKSSIYVSVYMYPHMYLYIYASIYTRLNDIYIHKAQW